MNRLLKIATLLLGLMLMSTAANAQASRTAQVIDPSTRKIELSTNQGKLIRLPRPANAVFIADTAIADVSVRSPSLIYVFAKGIGETTLYALDGRDQIVIAQRILIAPHLDRVNDMFRQLRPNAPVRATVINNKMVLVGTVESADIADEFFQVAAAAAGGPANVINRVRVASPNQVNIRVKIAEVSRDINKRIGFNWELFGQATSQWALGFAVGTDIVREAGAFILADDETDRIVSTFGNDSVSIDNVIDLLDDEGLITVLAEPNLTALSGETASFLAGGEFPIPIAQSDGVTTIQFRQFGIGLAFTPTVLGRDRINLKIIPEVSQLNAAGSIQANGFNIPSLTTRRADTTVELASGQSFAIAGLLQNTTNQTLSDVPGVKEIPILGALFRSDAFRRQESELMIVVTPYIVRPVSGRLPLPTDNYVPPKDLERFLLGQNHVSQPAPKSPGPLDRNGRPGLSGPAGFVLQ